MGQIKAYFKLIRVKHYIKNILIFLPLVFGNQLFDMGQLGRLICGFFAFSFVASVIYIINDLNDVEKDRLHPKKKNRPIASGKVSKKQAVMILFILLVCSGCMFFFSNSGWDAFAYLCIYFVLNLLYSVWLKHVPIVDVAVLSGGFLLRILFGSAVTGIPISDWLLLTVLSMSLYLSLGKRRNELVKTDGDTRSVLKSYNIEFLDKNMYVFLGLTNVFYALWSIDGEKKIMVWTVPVVMLICMKYSLDVEGDSDGDPVEVLLNDRFLLALVGIYVALMLAILYIG